MLSDKFATFWRVNSRKPVRARGTPMAQDLETVGRHETAFLKQEHKH